LAKVRGHYPRPGTTIVNRTGMGIVLELWKVTKTVNVRIRPVPDSIIPYRIVFEDKHKLSETEEKTKEYDAIAFKYLYMVAVPLLLAYAIYSVIYEEHKSWYSFIITWLVGSVYAYGFLMMVPSLYINYRLKSVAHMPAKAMTYKFLNTFIDDLFAFTIKMPILHRLATLRDDVIFFVYLYQSYKYKVDYTRVNEFGQGGVVDEPVVNKMSTDTPTAEASVQVGKQDKAEASGSAAKKGAVTRRK
jgi:Cleft lip and palate transmembrane protein 1 (CLPTM1)